MTDRSLVFVGMSGGVDSSVAAALLVEQGYEVVGVFMKNWSDDSFAECPWERDLADAKAVADRLGIPLISWNFEREYRAKVIEHFFAEYAAGRTPNPDIVCNREIKFGLFMDRALAQGAAYVATGHYARVVVRHGEPYLARPHDKRKDQTYFLSTLTPDRLQHVLFPLADLTKEEVRAKARDLGLPNADKPDSQGICFVGEINLFDFLRSRLPEKPGPIMTVEGELVGEHRGVWFYTIGQRHGLGTVHQSPSAGRVGGAAVSRSVSSGGIPYYVVGKDVTRNTLIVAAGPDHPALYAQAMVVDADVLRVAKTDLLTGLPVEVRIRHGMEPVPATVTFADQSTDRLLVVFDEEQRAVTPGQAAVFYRDGLVVGGGTIAEGTAVRPVPHPAAASVKAR